MLVHFEAQKNILCVKKALAQSNFRQAAWQKNRNDPICAVSPKVAKANKDTYLSLALVLLPTNVANVNDPLKTSPMYMSLYLPLTTLAGAPHIGLFPLAKAS